jgi:hypothetical protein
MFRTVFILIAVVAQIAATAGDAHARPSVAALRAQSAPTFRVRPVPNIIENGTDTVLFSVSPGDGVDSPQSVAFTPDGTAYFVENYGVLTRFSTTGTFTTIAVPRIYGGTLYAHGALWIGANSGLVRVHYSYKSRSPLSIRFWVATGIFTGRLLRPSIR